MLKDFFYKQPKLCHVIAYIRSQKRRKEGTFSFGDRELGTLTAEFDLDVIKLNYRGRESGRHWVKTSAIQGNRRKQTAPDAQLTTSILLCVVEQTLVGIDADVSAVTLSSRCLEIHTVRCTVEPTV